ncbi:aminotransferase class I/II-fold pyridoxal phosphate-dependent enzyme [Aliifodinibius sp. S!AR15-10]|uniref:DegT/DnrJ/EryC1/StrS family aminotransferase n=1 Tax=Aliifodinibius sp. S!AR15-10 TaxID=2950437 RepID=UPI002855FCCB|nr:aminotransferase class I/II-fold pyridoxal phosphate-dependent enzyme [Aliifodinibius sp. S!AR15-10]MDR8392374.1 aminotransferase class I/II-fold pyridoxal phosphate-dependent enzyme [Aliifodinibius sp. S!AR15-10]
MNYSAPRIYLSSPHMGGDELNYIHDAFDKNWIAPLGANVDGFEEDLQGVTGRNHAAVVTSGTAAIHLGLILCGVEPEDEVICQSFTFAATANPIRYQGATPVFVDSEPDTWNMDPDLLEQAIVDRMEKNGGKRPKAIVVVHLYGMPAKVDRILNVAAKYDIPVIEDAAEALGSSVNGRKCGSFGMLSVLSFNGNKIITTSGGGALLSDDEQLVKKARFLATQARDEAPHYQHSELGYNYRMSNIVAGIGRGQIKVLDERVTTRRANHDFYFRELNGSWLEMEILNSEFGILNSSPTGIYFLKEPDGYYSNRWLTTILVNPKETRGVTREQIRIELEKKNIETRPLWKPMHMQPLYHGSPYYGNGISDKLFEYGLCLPSGSNLTEEERERVVTSIQKVLK